MTYFYLKAENDADEILAICRITSPPVPTGVIRKIFPSCTIDVVHFSDEAMGFTFASGDSWRVLIDSQIPIGAKRFTAFHEFYHMLNNEAGFCKNTPEGKLQESRSDYFAACLLMPARWFRKYWEKCNDIETMMKIFGVSWEAASYSLMGLQKYLAA